MEIKTLKNDSCHSCHKHDIKYACDLCNKIAKMNMKWPKDVFIVNGGSTLVLANLRYANGYVTRGIYAVLFLVDQISSDIAFTQIGYERCPLLINVVNISRFIDELKAL